MKIFTKPSELKKKFKKPVVAIGVFDGIHLGHAALIRKVVTRAQEIKGTPAVVTFFPHPVQVLNKKVDISLLVSLNHRLHLIASLGVKVCFVLNFTKKFSQLDPSEFVKKYLVDTISPAEVFVGKNFHFGYNRLGDGNFLKKIGNDFNFKTTVVGAVRYKDLIVSSSLLRKLIAQGKLEQAEKLLGRKVSILGIVVRGDCRGKRIGTPTANINPGREILPPLGVYLSRVFLDGRIFHAISNIGKRPSFKKDNQINLEVHIFNFEENIYKKQIEIQFLKKIRNEKKFYSAKKLILQIEKDKKKALQIFPQKKF